MLEKVNKVQHEELQEQKDILQSIIDSEKNMLIVTDCNSISFVNSSFLEFFKIKSIEEFFKKYKTLFSIFEKNNLVDYIEINKKESGTTEICKVFYEVLKKTDESKKVVTIIDSSNVAKHFYINVAVINNDSNMYLLSLTDITKISIEKDDAEEKAYVDGLTGVNNRNKFEEVFRYELLRKERYKHPLSIALIDIDHFKKFNDNYGHLVGDEVLIIIANTLKKSVRKTDVFARWGGEEFVILFPNTTLVDAVKTSETLRKRVERLEHHTAGKVTVSFGVTEHKENDTLNSLFKRCDDALDLAKEDGRNCVKSL